jgi:peptidoglycan/LPS O-acetylase OafA/YrhL
MQSTGRLCNFDLIRFAAASTVWYAHCRTFYDLPGVTAFEYLGRIAVDVFFIVSGYFVTASYSYHKSGFSRRWQWWYS